MTIAVSQKQSSKPFDPVLPTPKSGLRSVWRTAYPYLCISWIALLLIGSLLIVHVHQQQRRIS